MDAVIKDRLLRRSGPDGGPAAESAATPDYYSPDPSECLRQCKASFLQTIPGLREGASYEEACQSLTKNQSHEWFWDLYCCDSTECGVHIELDSQALGQSPTVDLIINQCRDIGYDDIYDPGPPQITCANSSRLLIPLNVSPSNSITSSTSASAPSASVIATPSALPSETATPTAASGASTANPTSANATESKSDGFSSGARAAIGVCAALATASLAIALVFLRRRRRNTRGYHRTPPTPAQHTRASSEPPQTSYMPLFLTPPASSSSKTTPSTPPPLRLSDRRYLPPPPPRTTTTTTTMTPPSTPPAESTTSEGSMNASPQTTTISYPRAPANAPTTSSRLTPRHERRAITTTAPSSIRFGAPSSASTIPETAALRRSTSSSESGPGRTALSPLSSSSSRYPARPPRPHASPALEIPDLVTPAGPPPTWALPRPPPTASPSSSTTSSLQFSTLPHRLHPHAPLPLITPPAPAAVSSPLSPILSVSPLSSPRSPNSPARSPLLPSTPVASTTTPPPSSYHDISPQPQQKHRETANALLSSQLPILRNSGGSVHRDTHVSWGSWSGPGDGKRNMANSSSQRESNGIDGRASNVASKKLDLENLGGSY